MMAHGRRLVHIACGVRCVLFCDWVLARDVFLQLSFSLSVACASVLSCMNPFSVVLSIVVRLRASASETQSICSRYGRCVCT